MKENHWAHWHARWNRSRSTLNLLCHSARSWHTYTSSPVPTLLHLPWYCDSKHYQSIPSTDSDDSFQLFAFYSMFQNLVSCVCLLNSIIMLKTFSSREETVPELMVLTFKFVYLLPNRRGDKKEWPGWKRSLIVLGYVWEIYWIIFFVDLTVILWCQRCNVVYLDFRKAFDQVSQKG